MTIDVYIGNAPRLCVHLHCSLWSEELLFQMAIAFIYHRHNPAGCAILAPSADLQFIFGLGNAYMQPDWHTTTLGTLHVGYVHLQLW